MVNFGNAHCHTVLLEGALTKGDEGEMSPDFMSLSLTYVEQVQKILKDREPSNDIKLEWLTNLDCEYEAIIERCGFLE